MAETVTETFFLADELARESSSIPAKIYNLVHTILARNENDCVFAPIRSLQYLAVLSGREIAFVDSLSYTVQDGHGGRLIKLVWRLHHVSERGALADPVACDIIYYHEDGRDLQARVVGEFLKSLKQMDERYREHTMPVSGARILSLDPAKQ